MGRNQGRKCFYMCSSVRPVAQTEIIRLLWANRNKIDCCGAYTRSLSNFYYNFHIGLEIIMSQNDVRKLHKLFSMLIKSAMQPKCIIGSNQSVQPYHFGKMVQEILLDPQGIKTENWKMIGMSHAFVLLYNHLP